MRCLEQEKTGGPKAAPPVFSRPLSLFLSAKPDHLTNATESLGRPEERQKRARTLKQQPGKKQQPKKSRIRKAPLPLYAKSVPASASLGTLQASTSSTRRLSTRPTSATVYASHSRSMLAPATESVAVPRIAPTLCGPRSTSAGADRRGQRRGWHRLVYGALGAVLWDCWLPGWFRTSRSVWVDALTTGICTLRNRS